MPAAVSWEDLALLSFNRDKRKLIYGAAVIQIKCRQYQVRNLRTMIKTWLIKTVHLKCIYRSQERLFNLLHLK